ncbi:MAG: insulinase family protein [Bacteroidetes bacterium]|nr:insulinase family protein [Bacteroidota bacterium]
MLNRKIAPINEKIEFNSFPNPDKEDISSNIPLFFLKDTQYPVIKFTLTFNSGIWFEPQNGIATFAAKMLKGGTKIMNSITLEESLDYYGCNFDINIKRDICEISILTINKHFDSILKILKDIIDNSIFPLPYFEIQKQIVKDNILLENSNNSNLAIKTLQELVFGKNHPYGNNLNAKIIDNLEIEKVKDYYLNKLFAHCEMFICGNFTKDQTENIKNNFKSLNYEYSKKEREFQKYKPSIKEIKRKDCIQDTVIMGMPFPLKTDNDYLDLVILNEILGGYFGSRLMSNIREKSGYTYGIYSRIIPMKENSLFYIASEVSKGYSNKVINETQNEIQKLRDDMIGKEELDSVKQYMKGKLLLSIDGSFSKMDSFINTHKFGLDNSYYTKLYNVINTIDSKKLNKLAKKYLNFDKLSQVIIK